MSSGGKFALRQTRSIAATSSTSRLYRAAIRARDSATVIPLPCDFTSIRKISRRRASRIGSCISTPSKPTESTVMRAADNGTSKEKAKGVSESDAAEATYAVHELRGKKEEVS